MEFKELIERMEHVINNGKRFSFINYTTEEISNYYTGKSIYVNFENLIEWLKYADEEIQEQFLSNDIIKCSCDDED